MAEFLLGVRPMVAAEYEKNANYGLWERGEKNRTGCFWIALNLTYNLTNQMMVWVFKSEVGRCWM